MLALDQLAGDLRERAELARLAAATHDLDAPPGYASAAEAVAWVLADSAGAASDQRQLRCRELAVRRGRGTRRRSRRRRRSATDARVPPPHAEAASSSATSAAQPARLPRMRGHPHSARPGIDLAGAPADVDGRDDPAASRVDPRHGPVDRVGHPHRARRSGDAGGSAADRDGRQDPVGARVDRHDRVVQAIGDPGRAVRHHHRARREGQRDRRLDRAAARVQSPHAAVERVTEDPQRAGADRQLTELDARSSTRCREAGTAGRCGAACAAAAHRC